MRYANHYILSELLRVVEGGDPHVIRREFAKYMRRYRDDSGLLSVGKSALYAASLTNGTVEDLRARLKRMREMRRLEAVSRCAGLLAGQISYR